MFEPPRKLTLGWVEQPDGGCALVFDAHVIAGILIETPGIH
jgi:hypothetical protein